MSKIFPPPNPRMDNSVQAELQSRRRAVISKAEAVPDERLLRPELEAEIASDIVDSEVFDLLVLGDAITESEIEQMHVRETNPMYLGPGGEPRTRKVDVFLVTRRLVRGSPEWLMHRPSGGFPLLADVVVYDSGRRAVVLRVLDDPRDDPRGHLASRFVSEQLGALDSYVAATNGEIDAWNEALPEFVLGVISRERERRSGVEDRKKLLGPPVVEAASEPVPYSLPRRPRPRVRLDVVEVERLGGRMYLPSQDFAAVLNELQRSAQFFAEHPNVHALDESGMRDFVLAQLNAAFPAGGTGETFSKRGRSDIRVVTTLAAESGFGDCVFKAECKIWSGPAKAREGADQLCDRYLTSAEVRAAIILFARPPYVAGVVTRQACEELTNAFGAIAGDDVAGWPTVAMRHPSLPNAITVAVVVL